MDVELAKAIIITREHYFDALMQLKHLHPGSEEYERQGKTVEVLKDAYRELQELEKDIIIAEKESRAVIVKSIIDGAVKVLGIIVGGALVIVTMGAEYDDAKVFRSKAYQNSMTLFRGIV